jgi:hypothetical protein
VIERSRDSRFFRLCSSPVQNHSQRCLRIVGAHLHGKLIPRLQQRVAIAFARFIAKLRLGQHPKPEDLMVAGLQVQILFAKLAQGSIRRAKRHPHIVAA